jgi:hypothetical protein
MTEGLINSSKNQVEIWYKTKNSKLKSKWFKWEIITFPFYTTLQSKVKFSFRERFYVEQTEIGLIASFEIKTNEFNIDYLRAITNKRLTVLER